MTPRAPLLIHQLSDLEQLELRLEREFETQMKAKSEMMRTGSKSELSLLDVASDPIHFAKQLLLIEYVSFLHL